MALGLFWDIVTGLPWTPNGVGSLEPKGCCVFLPGAHYLTIYSPDGADSSLNKLLLLLLLLPLLQSLFLQLHHETSLFLPFFFLLFPQNVLFFSFFFFTFPHHLQHLLHRIDFSLGDRYSDVMSFNLQHELHQPGMFDLNQLDLNHWFKLWFFLNKSHWFLIFSSYKKSRNITH